jgi:hypothetical protein
MQNEGDLERLRAYRARQGTGPWNQGQEKQRQRQQRHLRAHQQHNKAGKEKEAANGVNE